jgi:hypothetical protein
MLLKDRVLVAAEEMALIHQLLDLRLLMQVVVLVGMERILLVEFQRVLQDHWVLLVLAEVVLVVVKETAVMEPLI